jgi:hypothetical protein
MAIMRLTPIALFLGLSAISTLGACASKQGSDPVVPQNNNSSADPNMDCRTEKPIGSSIPRTNCESAADRDQDRKGAQEMHSGVPHH